MPVIPDGWNVLEWTTRLPSRKSRDLWIGIAVGFAMCLASTSFVLRRRRVTKPGRLSIEDDDKSRPIEIRRDQVLHGVTELIGNTPLVRINSLSDALGVEILGKAEYLNPGGSVKDRVALRIIDAAEERGLIKPNTGSCIFEGTSGSTGISIATIARARGYKCTIIMPDDVAEEKTQALLALGASVERVRPVSIVDKKQFVNIARQRALEYGKVTSSDKDVSVATDELVVSIQDPSKAKEPVFASSVEEEDLPRGFFADQFENTSNYDAHFEGTGPEIWRQTNGNVDAFVSGAGTGGTIAGVGNYLKTRNPRAVICLADPEGSGLHNKVKHGVMFDAREKEGQKRRYQVDTIVEGIGLNRLTKNLQLALPVIDESFRITDAEAISMSRYIAHTDGLFLGSSSAFNLIAAVRLAKLFGKGSGKTIVTVLCDSGTRHYSKFWNDKYIEDAKIAINANYVEDLLKD